MNEYECVQHRASADDVALPAGRRTPGDATDGHISKTGAKFEILKN